MIILDPFMKYPLGYSIDTAESSTLIRAAMKNGIDHVFEQTGEYIAPYQVQSDHYALKDLGPFYANIARMHTPARVGNAKSKVIEPYFKHLNKRYCQLLHNWTGFGLKSRRENQPNMELKNKIKKQFPDRQGVIRQIEEIIQAEREAKGDKYFAALLNAEKRLMDRRDYLRALGVPREKTVKASGKGLQISIDNTLYIYDTLDLGFRRHLTLDWQVTIDPANLKSILVEDEDGRVSFVLEEKYTQPMAIADQTPEDREQLKALRHANEKLTENVLEAGIERRGLIAEHFSQHDSLGEFQQKLMLTQGGQQKDPLQLAKGKMLPRDREKKKIAEHTKTLKENEQDIEDATWWEEQEKSLISRVDISKYL
ncbi:MAG: hypothetical protein A3K54_00155 [Omnitrophica WOR_2 bacterium RBG_13_44_8]|nr:MAG: hypothetical protein A3K54_00155 [Omnitrophica WOR_2 bacterium RBG_13_44_8]